MGQGELEMWVGGFLPRFGVRGAEVLGARRFFWEGPSSEQVEAGEGLREVGGAGGGACKEVGMRGAAERAHGGKGGVVKQNLVLMRKLHLFH